MLIVFDFDGPLFDGRTARNKAAKATSSELETKIGPPRHCVETAPLFNPAVTIALMYAGAGLPPAAIELAESVYRRNLSALEQQQTCDPKVREVLQCLLDEGCELAVLSRRRESGLRDRLQDLGMANFFAHIHGRDTGDYAKPQPEALLAIVTKTRWTRDWTLFVGDDDTDWLTAHRSRIAFLYAAWTGEPVSRAAQEDVQRLLRIDELPRLVAELGRSSATEGAEAADAAAEVAKTSTFSFFTGAGVSMASGLSGWQDCYLPVLSSFMPQDALKGRSLPDLVGLVAVRASDQSRMLEMFRTTFGSEEAQPNHYHFCMARSNCWTIWTTNYDKLFERAIVASGQDVGLVRDDEEMKESFGRGRLLVKANGDFTKQRAGIIDHSLVLTEEHFDLAERDREEIWRYFEDEYRTSTIFFVGLSFDDPSLKRILSIAARKVMRTRNTHFFLTVPPAEHLRRIVFLRQREMLERRHIRTITFETFADLESFVARLCWLSVRPVVAVLGSNGLSQSTSSSEAASIFLPGGIISAQATADLCARLGEKLASNGFRVASGHGHGVGVPAVAGAYHADRRSARFFLRVKGTSLLSREAPAIIFDTENIELVRREMLSTAHILMA